MTEERKEEERKGVEWRGEERREKEWEKRRDGAGEENNVQRNMVRKTARGGWSGPRESERRIMAEKGAEEKRGELCICTHMYVCSRICIHDCVSIVGVASVAADVAAVPRYRRGCSDALHKPSRHDLSALSTTIRYPSSYCGFLSLSGTSSPRFSIGDARFASSSGCPKHATLRSGTTKCVCDPYIVLADSTRGEWISREKINEESR